MVSLSLVLLDIAKPGTPFILLCVDCAGSHILAAQSNFCKNGHREKFYAVLDGCEVDESTDDYSLGLHLIHEHGVVEKTDFDKLLRVCIVENCSPSALEKKEHLYIHKFKTLHPVGLNKINPFGLSRLCAA